MAEETGEYPVINNSCYRMLNESYTVKPMFSAG